MKDWTVLAYLVADHPRAPGATSPSLDEVAHTEVDNIMWAADLDRMNVAIQVDFTDRPGVLRVIAGDSSTPARTLLPEADAGRVETLTAFVDAVKQQCEPTKHYLLLLWGHGAGPIGFFDDPSGVVLADAADTLTLDELSQVTAYMAGPSGFGQKLDLLLAKSCCVGTLESVWELRDSVRYLVSSQAKVPVRAWTYGDLFAALHGGRTLEEIGPRVLDALMFQFQFAQQRNERDEVPYSLLDLDRAYQIEAPWRALTAALQSADPRSAVVRAAVGAARGADMADPALLDVGRLAHALSGVDGLAGASALVADAVHRGPSPLVVDRRPLLSDFSGVSVFHFPPDQLRSGSFFADAVTSFDYETLDLCRRTGWNRVAFAEDPQLA